MTRHDKSIAPRAGRFGFVQHAVTGMLAPPLSSGHTSRALPAERDACNPLWINQPVTSAGAMVRLCFTNIRAKNAKAEKQQRGATSGGGNGIQGIPNSPAVAKR